jgi:NitT/TauT family transport system substrate-binding protein
MNPISRRGAIVALGAFAAMPLGGRAWAAEKLTISVPATDVDQCAVFIAVQKGYFAAEGLDPSITVAGGGVATPALLSGSTQASASPASALSAILRGADLRILLVFGISPPYQLWGDNTVHSLADLKGKAVGVQSRGDTFELSTRIALAQAGISADSVGFTPLGVGTTVGAALSNGAIAAMCTASVEVAKIRALGEMKNAHLVLDYFGKVHMPFNGLVTSQKLIADSPDVVHGMVTGIVKAVRYARAFKTQTIAITAKYGTAPDMSALAGDYDAFMQYLTPSLTAAPNTLVADLGVRAELFGIPKAQIPPIDKVYDFRVAQAVNAELDRARWRPTA